MLYSVHDQISDRLQDQEEDQAGHSGDQKGAEDDGQMQWNDASIGKEHHRSDIRLSGQIPLQIHSQRKKVISKEQRHTQQDRSGAVTGYAGAAHEE